MAEQFSNNASSTLNGAIDNDDTSLVVTSASSFPTTGNFRIRIDDEIMLVTAVSGTTFTVTRAVEGTSAASHSNGADVRHVLTAAALQAIVGSRLVFDDLCDYSTLPSGTSSSGQLTFDSTRLRRELGGTSTSTYDTPVAALNGPLVIEMVHENISAYTAGNFSVQLIRDTDSAVVAAGYYQSDGNLVCHVGGTSRSASGVSTAATTYTRDDSGNMHRSLIAINEQKLAIVSLGNHPGVGSLGPTSENSGRRGMAGARFVYASTLDAGDNMRFKLETTSTRKVALYLVRVWRGAVV